MAEEEIKIEEEETKEVETEESETEELGDKIEVSEETDDKTLTSGKETQEKEVDLGEKVEGLEKTVSGLKHGISAERGKRQELQGRLSQVSELFQNAQTVRKEETSKPSNIPVEIDEDGNAFILPEVLKSAIVTENKALQDKVAMLEHSYTQGTQAVAVQNQLSAVISEKPEYREAFGQLQTANVAANKMFADYIQTNGINPPQSFDEAMDIIEQAGLDQEFAKSHSVDIETAITAFARPRQMRKALNTISSGGKSSQEKTMKTLQALGDKPSSHVGRGGSPGGTDLTLDKIANLSNDDFLDLSDAQMSKIDRLLKAEE